MPKNALKIAYIFDGLLPSNEADKEQLVNTIAALARRGMSITLFLPASNVRDNTDLDEIRQFYGVDGDFRIELVHSLYPSKRIFEKVSHCVACAFLRVHLRQFDCVFTRNIPALVTSILLGIPVIYDTYRPWPAQYHGVLRPFFQRIFKSPYFLGMLVHSSYAQAAFISAGLGADRCIVAHNGFNPALFEPRLSPSAAREKIGVSIEGSLALYAGRLTAAKGIHSLLDIAEAVPDVTFMLIGSEGEGEIERRAAGLSNVQIKGWLSYRDLASYLYAADILMLPTSTGALKKVGNTVLPIKLFPYMAAGRPIFAPRSPDTVDLLRHGENAFLVEADDMAAAISGFKTLVGDAALIERLGLGAKAMAAELTWDKRAEKIDHFMRQQLERYRRERS